MILLISGSGKSNVSSWFIFMLFTIFLKEKCLHLFDIHHLSAGNGGLAPSLGGDVNPVDEQDFPSLRAAALMARGVKEDGECLRCSTRRMNDRFDLCSAV